MLHFSLSSFSLFFFFWRGGGGGAGDEGTLAVLNKMRTENWKIKTKERLFRDRGKWKEQVSK